MMDEKKTAPGLGAENAAIYQEWKKTISEKGGTLEDLLAMYEAAGMLEYVKKVRNFIQQMEEFERGPCGICTGHTKWRQCKHTNKTLEK